MEIINDKALLLRTRTPQKYSVIPHSHYLGEEDGGHKVLVRWGLDEARVLRNLGVKNVPSPIIRRYNWPGRYRPMKHQLETASFLTLHRRAFVLNEPGTGKTLSALWAADYLMSIGEVRRCLVLCPLSIMHSAWMGDIINSILHRTAIVAHHAQASRRVEMVQGDYEFVIMNYDGLPLVAKEVAADGRFDLVIVDEANALKSATTRRWKTVNSVITPDTYIWLMTGTPASQSPLDAYGLAKLVNPAGVPWSFAAWRDKVMNKITQFKWAAKPDAKQKVFDALQPAVRFTKDMCLDLPPVMVETREVDMTPQQMKYYRLIKDQMLAVAAGETISAVNKAVVVNKLLQISAGAVYSENHEVVEFDCAPRLRAVEEVLEETDRKVLIFALFRSSIDAIVAHLSRKGESVGVIHGDVTATKRGELINKFQNTPEPRVLVMQPQATAHGITLTAADTVVFFGPLMSVEQYLQCIARADRQGQTSDKVTVVHIQSSPIEKKMFEALQKKVDDHALLTDMFDAEIKNFELPVAKPI
jgi:SNF2 family DNA or RNA helicase